MLKLLIAIGLMVGPMFLTASRTMQKKISSKTYTVQSGDSLYSISKRFKVPINALQKANKLEEGSLLHPGQKLTLPTASLRPPSKTKSTSAKKTPSQTKKSSRRTLQSRQAGSSLQIYQVKAGDTLSAIAREQGITVKELLKTNHMKPGSLIRVGQTLVLPKRGGKRAESQPAPSPKKQMRTEKKTAKKNTRIQKSKEGIHVVQSGDTLFSIARKYHTPLKDLMALNGIAPTDLIHPGQELKIPGSSYRAKKAKIPAKRTKRKEQPQKAKAKPVKAVVYTVKHGDTLWGIAKKQKVSVAEIRRLNKMERKDIIRSGMKLLIKEGTAGTEAPGELAKTQKTEKIYTVKKGDTLWMIAKRNKTTVAELRRLNKMKRGDIIHTGMKLTVGYEKASPTRLAQKEKKRKKTANSKKRSVRKSASEKKTKVAGRTSGSRKKSSRKRKGADERISSALAALNAKSKHGRSGGGDYNVIRTAKKFLGRRYVWGAEGPSCFDCSGFTQYVMRKSKGVKIPRVSRKQAYYGKYVTRSQLKPGDLIFFDTSHRRRGYVNHVGIYIGNNKFIHASSARHRVVITSLNRPFYRARFKWGRRVN